MKQITITESDAGQRLDKLLARYMRKAPKSFLYKMLRKKNITLNGKKAEGKELLQPGDQVKLFLSDETYEKFGGILHDETANFSSTALQYGAVPVLVPGEQPPEIIYQDEHILLFNKPAGMLSQKAAAEDVSLVEYLNAYLLSSGAMSREQMQLVHPAVCNRLDRNTSGLVAAGLSLAGLQTMNRLIRERKIRKFYRCIVCGKMYGSSHLHGYLEKDSRTNTVHVSDTPSDNTKPIETEYRVLAQSNDLTLLEVHLITGRSHQIRAHLASMGHPILGDGKYGDMGINRTFARSHGVSCQLLHACRLEFPEIDGPLSYLSGKVFYAPVPELFHLVMPEQSGGRI
ncbi:MAG: RluA family pseudouridine synthase [Lachnospiraceae bacterium]|nr:RluA family pseudouridine synthase [Lachnospiraceae bacterium]